MAEEVNTGGLVRFGYKGEAGKLDEERKSDINRGYEEYALRKKTEKRNRLILIGVIVLVVLVGLGYWFLK